MSGKVLMEVGMRGGKIASMMSAALILSSSAGAVVPTTSSGLASNRTALALATPEGQTNAVCTPGQAGDCGAVSSGAHAGNEMLYLLGGLVLAGGIAGAAVTSGHQHHPVSP